MKNKKYGIRVVLLAVLVAVGAQAMTVLDFDRSTAYGYSVDKVLSKAVTDSKTSSNNSFDQKMEYTDADGYKGSLDKNGASFVKSGSYNPGSPGHVHTSSCETYNYVCWKCGYTTTYGHGHGAGYCVNCKKDSCLNQGKVFKCGMYEGQGYIPASDTRIYQQNYAGTVYKTVKEYPELTSIVIVKQPNKAHYKEYEDFEPEGMVVQAIYADGHQEEVTGYTLSKKINLDPSVTSIRVTFSENGGTAYADVPITVAKLTGIHVSKLPDTVEYLEGLVNIDLTGGELALEFNDGSTKEISLTEASVITHGSEVGEIEIKVGYKEFTTTYKAKVKAKSPIKLEIMTPPSKLQYIEDLPFDFDGISVKVTYDNGTFGIAKELSSTDGAALQLGQTFVTIAYYENDVTVTCQQPITVIKKSPVKLIVEKVPDKVKYEWSEPLDLSGSAIRMYYDNGKDELLTLDQVTATGYEAKQTGKQTITVSSKGCSDTFEIEVGKAPVTEITLITSPGAIVVQNASLDLNDATIEVTRADDSKETVKVTKDMILPFDSSVLGKQTIKITYEGKQCEFEITVVRKPSSSKPNTEKPIGEVIVKGEDCLDKSDVVLSEGENGNIRVKVNQSHDAMYMVIPMLDNKVARNVINNTIPSFQAIMEGKLYVKITGDAEFEFIDNSKDFVDTNTHWAKQEIDKAASREIFAGIGDKRFAPDDTMTIAMMAAILHRLDGYKADQLPTNKGQWYDPDLAWVKEYIAREEDLVRPEAAVTKEQLARMLYQFAEHSGVEVEKETDPVTWMQNNGILIERIGGSLQLSDTATRAEVATIINKSIEAMLIRVK
ncbi:bacterial Ig-like domain-containing protein [Sinanaerobacter sp. ZZT-01]|uniref:bacterial Ig-like domain-containing protein n=1 Tax=Sinanaerobacter sp. ZZT-01 TaxID=3111540 RepID=UPI002D7A267C|nr:bacterial Ig-like domain-containing protein [Sinanaerobacter sp. ZZT-01]WRR94262.1 bacterial Ig-like domain-containing protein [Sinanaerobacter sp. ZZT-01]